MTDTNLKYIDEREELRCPYLGLLDDKDTSTDFPSELNYCHRSKPIALPSFMQQRKVCLATSYSECPFFSDSKLKRLPKNLRIPHSNPNKKRLIILLSLIGLIALLIAFIIIGWSNGGFRAKVQSFFVKAPTPGIPLVIFQGGTSTHTVTPTQTATDAIIPPRTPQPTEAMGVASTATFTPIPTDTIIPSLTPTPACNYSITFIAISYYAGNNVLISFQTPVDLTEYLVLDEFGQPTQILKLPGIRMKINGIQIYTYGTYLWNLSTSTRLYLEVQASNDDVIELEFMDASGRYCSNPFRVPAEVPTSTQTPKNAPVTPTEVPTEVPTEEPTEEPTLEPTPTP